MNELQIFRNDEFGSVRTMSIDGKPWFVANDVARALGYKRPADAVTAHCKGSVKHRYLTEGGEQEVKMIPEGDIYRLVVKSHLPKADEFERWIFDSVLPSIRQNGGYIMNQEQMTPEQIVANALIVANNIIEQKNRQIEEMKPKADFFDAVADSKTAISMNDVAKVLAIKGYGRNKIFEFLRNEKILDRNNIPYQRYVDAGWFRVVEQKYNRGSEVVITKRTLVYQKGVDGIRKRILRWKGK